MECNKTFISIKQLEEQDISADKICSILFQLYDELAINDNAVKVDDLKAFRSHMNTLLDRILKLYKANEDDLSKLALFKRIEDKEKNVEEYLDKINELEEDINKLDSINIQLKEKTSDYEEIVNKNRQLEEENEILKERLSLLDKIDIKSLENDNSEMSKAIEVKEEKYNHILEEKNKLDSKIEELDNKYVEVNKEFELLDEKYTLGKDQVSKIEEKNKELALLIKENEELIKKKDSLEEMNIKINELKEVNKTIKDEMKSIESLLGKEDSEDSISYLKKLEALQLDVADLLEDYLVNNYIYEIEDELELNNMGLIDYLDFMNKYIFNTKSNVESYYQTTKRIYKVISRGNKTDRNGEES